MIKFPLKFNNSEGSTNKLLLLNLIGLLNIILQQDSLIWPFCFNCVIKLYSLKVESLFLLSNKPIFKQFGISSFVSSVYINFNLSFVVSIFLKFKTSKSSKAVHAWYVWEKDKSNEEVLENE